MDTYGIAVVIGRVAFIAILLSMLGWWPFRKAQSKKLEDDKPAAPDWTDKDWSEYIDRIESRR